MARLEVPPITDIKLFSTAFVAGVAVVSLVLTALTYVAARRTGYRRVYFVSAAMGVLFVKSAIASYALARGAIAHQHLEALQGVFDLAMVSLLFVPFWLQR